MNTSPPNPFRPLRFRLYVDESGDHAYSRLDQTPHRYLALLGVWFEQPTKYTQFHDALESLKRSIWGPRPDSPVVLHRSDIINRKGPFGIFKDPSLRDRFDNELLRIIKDAEFKMVCVVIDKKSHRDQYADPYHPYHYAMAAMLERYAGWLNYFNRVGDIMAESRGGEEDI